MPEEIARALDTPPPALARIERAGRVLLIAIVAVGVLVSIRGGSVPWYDPAKLGLVTFGALYLGVFVVLGDRAERSESRALLRGYFALQLALAAAMVALQASLGFFGMTWMVLMPLVAHAVFLLGAVGIAVVAGTTVALVMGHGAVLGGLGSALDAGIGAALATGFVVLFANVARLEVTARTRSELLREELEEAHRRLAEYSVQAEELAASRERNRLAREIHDSLGHHLTVMKVQLEAAEMVLRRDPDDAIRRMSSARELAREGLAEVRRSVAALRASPLNGRPLPEALGSLVDPGEGAALKVIGEPRSLPPEATLALYRAAQEGLTNARRHARARRVEVTLDYRAPDAVRLEVSDDGAGTSREEDGDRPGFGLLGLDERVRLISGRLATRSRPGEGFTLEVEVPG